MLFSKDQRGRICLNKLGPAANHDHWNIEIDVNGHLRGVPVQLTATTLDGEDIPLAEEVTPIPLTDMPKPDRARNPDGYQKWIHARAEERKAKLAGLPPELWAVWNRQSSDFRLPTGWLDNPYVID